MTSFTTKCITPVLCCLYPGNLRCVKFDSMLSRLSPTKGVPGDPRGSHWRQIPHPASLPSRNFKNALYYLLIHISQLPQHFIFSRLPTFFAPISPSSLLFQANSPFTPSPYSVPPPSKECTSVIFGGKTWEPLSFYNGFSENVVAATSSYQMKEVLSFCYRERASPPSI